MDNDLDIFRKRQERKKKKKVYPEPQCVFIPNSKGGEKADEYIKTLEGAPKECLVNYKEQEEKSMLMNWQKPYTEDLRESERSNASSEGK